MAAMTPAARKRISIPPVSVFDNSAFSTEPDDEPVTVNVNGVSGEQLRSLIERIEHVVDEIHGLQSDVKEIKKEAKDAGFDVKVINALLKIRRQDKDDLDEFESLLDVYRRALGPGKS